MLKALPVQLLPSAPNVAQNSSNNHGKLHYSSIMEPLSLAARIAGLSDEVLKLLRVINDYISTAINASATIRDLRTQLELLESNLVHLQEFLRTEVAIKEFDNTSILVRLCEGCKKDLKSLRDRLDPNHDGRNRQDKIDSGHSDWFRRAAKWSLQVKETRDAQRSLRAYCQTFEMARQSAAWL